MQSMTCSLLGSLEHDAAEAADLEVATATGSAERAADLPLPASAPAASFFFARSGNAGLSIASVTSVTTCIRDQNIAHRVFCTDGRPVVPGCCLKARLMHMGDLATGHVMMLEMRAATDAPRMAL